MVAESDDLRRGWGGSRRYVGIQDGIVHPGPHLAGSYEMSLHRSPPVPNQETIKSSEDDSEANNGDGSIFGDIHQVIF